MRRAWQWLLKTWRGWEYRKIGGEWSLVATRPLSAKRWKAARKAADESLPIMNTTERMFADVKDGRIHFAEDAERAVSSLSERSDMMAEDAVEKLCKHLETNRPDYPVTSGGWPEHNRRVAWWKEVDCLIAEVRAERQKQSILSLPRITDLGEQGFLLELTMRDSVEVRLPSRQSTLMFGGPGQIAIGPAAKTVIQESTSEAREAEGPRPGTDLDAAALKAADQVMSWLSNALDALKRTVRPELHAAIKQREGLFRERDGLMAILEKLTGAPRHGEAPQPTTTAWRCRPGWVLCGACKELQPWSDPAHETQPCRKCGAEMELKELPDA